jgi:hypothetical protein
MDDAALDVLALAAHRDEIRGRLGATMEAENSMTHRNGGKAKMTQSARPACPNCSDAKAVVPILYGHFTRKGIEELRKEYGSEGYVLGGCSIEPGLERWHCKTCDHGFGDIFD